MPECGCCPPPELAGLDQLENATADTVRDDMASDLSEMADPMWDACECFHFVWTTCGLLDDCP